MSSAEPADVSACPMNQQTMQALGKGGCPVDHKDRVNPRNNMLIQVRSCIGMQWPRHTYSQCLQEKQLPAEGQTMPLSTERVMSSIPKTSEFTPPHQEQGNSFGRYWLAGAQLARTDAPVWEYPSEQMFYNAMKRKGWDPKEQDMTSVVSIHNTVNERCWLQVLAWEALHADE